MFCVSLRPFSSRTQLACLLAAVTFSAGAITPSNAQRPKGADEPLFAEFKGVRIGMTTEETRKKLGSPRDKADEMDIYLFNENQSVQIYYDKTKTVSAISIDFMTGATDIPTAKDIVGADPEQRADGSSYKMVRYPKAGYWVSYSRTAGKEPTITITMQKIEH